MYKGACLCGAVQFEYTGDLTELVACHCLQCRKVTGSAFITIMPAQLKYFKLIQGASALKSYQSIPGKHRMFCSNCGSPIYSYFENNPEHIRLRAGAFETPLPFTNPTTHIFVAGKARWDNICDNAPQYAEFKPAE